MTRSVILTAALSVVLVVVLGCAGGGGPVAPAGLTSGAAIGGACAQTHLWGYYDVYVDAAAQTATAVLNRSAMFAANVTSFINAKPIYLGLQIVGTTPGSGFVDVDLDVSLTHPFPGLHQYDGYDVRGIFIGNGSQNLSYNPALLYAAHKGNTQEMYDFNLTTGDPHSGLVGMPDGFTRWWNPTEFTTPGMFGYIKGSFASAGYNPTATLNPYKYFADDLGVTDSLYTFLTTPPSGGLKSGVFSAGSTNTRNYYLRFPMPDPGVKFAYAVLANWSGTQPQDHPANAPEACGINASVIPDLYYVSPSDKGGKLKLDISFPRIWGEPPSAIFVESSVLTNPHQFTPSEMIPVGGNASFSTYHVEINADNITGNSDTTDNEFWVIPQYDAFDYTNELGIPNAAGADKLASFFRYDLYVSPVAGNKPPICSLAIDPSTPSPAEDWDTVSMKFDASGSSDPDPGDTLTFSWDFDGDGVYGEPVDDAYTPPDDTPTHVFNANYTGKVWVKVSDSDGHDSTCSVNVVVKVHPSMNIDVTNDSTPATDLAMDPTNGDILVYYPNVGEVRRYTRASWFAGPPATYNVAGGGTNARFIDTNFKGYFEIAYVTSPSPPSGTMQMYYYSNTGSLVTSNAHGWAYIDGMLDMIGFPSAGPAAGGLGAFMYSNPYITGIGNVRYDPSFSGTAFTTVYMTGPYAVPTIYGAAGANRLSPSIIKAASLESNGEYWWWLEGGPDYTVTRWNLAFDVLPFPPTFGVYQIAGDGDFQMYDPQDLARNKDGTVFVLDKLSSGQYKIKGFNFDGSSVSPITGFGSSPDWAYTPIRLEGSDFDNMLAVLQINGTSSYLSVFP